jgi:glycerol uptake facilitator-like aquaporin
MRGKNDARITMNGVKMKYDHKVWYTGIYKFFYHPSPPSHYQVTWYNILLHEGLASLIFYTGIALSIVVGAFSPGEIAIVHGLAFFVAAAIFSPFGCGYVNPHLTLVLYFMGKLPGRWYHIFFYLIAQGLGSLFSVIITIYSIVNQDASTGLGAPVRSVAIEEGYALLIEATGTCLLIIGVVLLIDFTQRAITTQAYWMYFGIGTGKNTNAIQKYNAHLFNGSVTTVPYLVMAALFSLLVFMFIAQTGAAFNFWRWFIPTLWSGIPSGDWWVYVVGHPLGAFVAWIFSCMILFLIDWSQNRSDTNLSDEQYSKEILEWLNNKKEKSK